jgi:hypothetical protein
MKDFMIFNCSEFLELFIFIVLQVPILLLGLGTAAGATRLKTVNFNLSMRVYQKYRRDAQPIALRPRTLT